MAEKKLDKDAFLVSETDEKGIITFANEDFCSIAGYELDELLGKPHNIVRHRDMPKAAFKDLWDTVKQGKVWTGYVKNSCKNENDYYWVYATVYPMKNGYMSCRRMANSDEIASAIELYKTLT
ncbi:MAG: PAS domain-containing protein [Campylobacterales bacterium]